ncbi:MAG: CapA family protein [Candidatus Delongbacteria bacterium]|nr:CapA family protein [Candidatus Delongbacteria bacterium]
MTSSNRFSADCRVLIGGDLCAIQRNEAAFIQGDRAHLLGPFDKVFASADLRILNIECPLISRPDPLPKTGPVLGAPREAIVGILAIGVDLAVLANNHIMDHRTSGLLSTLEALDDARISHVGAGPDLDAAWTPAFVDRCGVRFGVLAVAAHEYSIAGPNSAGAAPMDPWEMESRVRALAKSCDFPILFVHAGPNKYPWPTPRLQILCRKLAQWGAGIVVCQHSHIAGAMESVPGGPAGRATLVYGQGNLFFDLGARGESEWNRGVLLDVAIQRETLDHQVELLPYLQSVDGAGLQAMSDDRQKLWLEAFHRRSRDCQSPEIIRSRYQDWATSREHETLLLLLSDNRYLKWLNRKWPWAGRVFSRRRRRLYLNLLRCEDHRELLETLFEMD